MNKTTKKGNVTIDNSSPVANNVIFKIYQDGYIVNKTYTETIKRENNELTIEFTIDNTIEFGKNIGKLIDIILANNEFNNAINRKTFSNKLDLNFELHFKNETFNANKFFSVKPNFFNVKSNLSKFYKGLSLFIGSISGLYKPFSYANIDYLAVIDNKQKSFTTQKEHDVNFCKKLTQTIVELN